MIDPKPYKAIGVMSGTSLDGIDVLACEFVKVATEWQFTIVAGETYAYANEMVLELKNAQKLSAYQLALLHNKYGKLIGETLKNFQLKYKFDADFVASHGYTVFHEPNNNLSLQIGSGAEIAAVTKLKTVCDFRINDVALGGNGAPLVPVGDKLLFADYGACLNLGGFSNISFDKEGQRLAFDICPVNFVLNAFANKLGFAYDKAGEIARTGLVDDELLNKLNNLFYYKQAAPKSLGREFVEQQVYPLINNDLPVEHILRTYTEHAALQISDVINKQNLNKVLITGGGAYNTYLIELLKEQCTNELIVPSNNLVNFKEALLFAFLGVLRINNDVNCLASVTGASNDNIGGAVFAV